MLGCVLFHLIPIPCKPGDILSNVIIRRIKYVFMRVTSHILNAVLETFETRKIRRHSLGSHMTGCVTNVKYSHNINAPWSSITDLRRSFIVNGSAATNQFSYVESFLKFVSNFLNCLVRNHLFTISMMLSVLSKLKLRGVWQIWKCNYLSTDPS